MTFFSRLILGLLAALPVFGSSSLNDARRAQAMLGEATWSRILRIENTTRHGVYPAVVDALVFEEGGLLWFYTATDGTQSLSLHRNHLAYEKENLAVLLREIDPGFTNYVILPDVSFDSPPDGRDPVANGCFIECLAALRARVGHGERIERARLLSCYATTPAGQRGHTVLTFETSRGFYLLDPGSETRPRQLSRTFADDPLGLAKVALQGEKVVKARWVEVDPVATQQVARLGSSRQPLENGVPRLTQ